MARKAGNSGTYDFCLIDKTTGYPDKSRIISFTSVTTVIKSTLASPALLGWNYRVTRDNIAGLVAGLEGMTPEGEDDLSLLEILADADVLEEVLKENRLRPEDLKEEAADVRGNPGHAYLERLASGDASVDTTPYLAVKDAIFAWWNETKPKVVESEVLLVSLRHQFAGTADLVWYDSDGRLVMTDLKTRKKDRGAYESDHVQTGAYKIAYEEQTGRKIDRRTVLVAREDGTYLEEDSTIDETAFLHLLSVYNEIRRVR